jgi:hypothetical protein
MYGGSYMARSKKVTSNPLYKIGDLVACYGKTDGLDQKENLPVHLVAGWIEDVESTVLSGIVYRIRWADRVDRDPMPVTEEQITPLRNLVDAIRRGEVT